MRKKGLIFFGAMAMAWSMQAHGQVKYSNEFLAIGVGARTMGMGGAGVASINDATAGYWNPSLLTAIEGKADISLMHAEYFAGIAKYDYAGASYRIDDNTAAGISFIRLGIDDIPNTLELIDNNGNIRYDRISHFSSADLGVLFSLGRKSSIEGLRYGANFKLVHRRTGEFATAWGFGLDAAAAYNYKKWRFAAVARDITGTFNAWIFNTDDLKEVFEITGNKIPENSLEVTVPSLHIGSAREFRVSEKITALAEIDLRFYFDGQRHVLLPLGFTGIDPYVGMEWIYNGWLAVRLGAGQLQWAESLDGGNEINLQPNLGIGINFRNLRIDYALTDIGDLSAAQYSNLVSLSYRIK